MAAAQVVFSAKIVGKVAMAYISPVGSLMGVVEHHDFPDGEVRQTGGGASHVLKARFVPPVNACHQVADELV